MVQAVRSLPVFSYYLYVYQRECLRDFELFLHGSLSQPNILSVGFTDDLSHPPLSCSDWLRDTEKQESEGGKGRECEAELF